MTYFNISFIGAGNVAWHLAQALENAGHHVHEIYNRDPLQAKALVKKLYNAEVKETLDFTESESTLFVIAVSDDALREVATEITLPSSEAMVVHTSGNKGIEIFEGSFINCGIFYPLQTISRSRTVDFQETPFLIEASNEASAQLLSKLAQSISKHVAFVEGQKRRHLHVSAVFASNFTNHLLFIAKQYASTNKVDFKLLKPLIAETVNKALELGPENAQTGPAARGDLQTLDNHLELLEGDERVQEIYKLLSQHILDQRYYEK